MTTFKINAQRSHDGYVTHFNALWGPTVTIIIFFKHDDFFKNLLRLRSYFCQRIKGIL